MATDELLERFTVIIVRTPEPDAPMLTSAKDYAAVEKQKAEAFALLASDCDAATRPELAALCRRMVAEQERQARMLSGRPEPGEEGLVETPWWQQAAWNFLFGSSFREFGLVDAVVYAWVAASVTSLLIDIVRG